jgi:hypothetical protein
MIPLEVDSVGAGDEGIGKYEIGMECICIVEPC